MFNVTATEINCTQEMTQETPLVFPKVKTMLQKEWEEVFSMFDDDDLNYDSDSPTLIEYNYNNYKPASD